MISNEYLPNFFGVLPCLFRNSKFFSSGESDGEKEQQGSHKLYVPLDQLLVKVLLRTYQALTVRIWLYLPFMK